MRPLLQPMDSISPWPRKRSRESSSTHRIARVRELPASTAAAILGLLAIASRLHGGDTVIQSQVQNGRLGHPSVNVRIVFEGVFQAGGGIVVGQHPYHGRFLQ